MIFDNMREDDNNTQIVMVTIQCFVYNHAPFLRQCLDGFVKQKTSFSFEAIVHDDASTDESATIIQEYASKYPGIIKPIIQTENLYSKRDGSINRIVNQHTRGKYIAICEGDDYWIDPNKLQLQVDFMETHPDYVLCHTDFDLTSGGYRNRHIYLDPDDTYFPQSFCRFNIATLTSLFRSDTYFHLPKLWENKQWPMGDLPLWIELSHEGKIKYFNKVTSCYRILQYSASHGSLEKEIAYSKTVVDICNYYADYYGIGHPKFINDSYYAGVVRLAFIHDNVRVAREYKQKAKECGHITLKMWVYYYATVIKPMGWIIRFLKR